MSRKKVVENRPAFCCCMFVIYRGSVLGIQCRVLIAEFPKNEDALCVSCARRELFGGRGGSGWGLKREREREKEERDRRK